VSEHLAEVSSLDSPLMSQRWTETNVGSMEGDAALDLGELELLVLLKDLLQGGNHGWKLIWQEMGTFRQETG
jgi:hypothetical protein